MDATFLMNQFIGMTLKNGGSVCFVGMLQSLNHFSSISQKLGVNLNTYREQGQFVSVDTLKMLGECILHEGDGFPLAMMDVSDDCGQSNSLKLFYEHIREVYCKLPCKTHTPNILIVDEISSLVLLGWREKLVTNLVNYLKQLVLVDGGYPGCLLVRTHSDHKDWEDDELGNILSHQANISLYVNNLPSGYCKEVDGEVRSLLFEQSRILHWINYAVFVALFLLSNP